MTEDKIIDKAKNLLETWKYGSLQIGNLGYKFEYYKFLNIAYLYLHGVDAKNPNLMDTKNPHDFIPDFMDSLTKVNEQTRIDFREIGFLVEGQSELAKYIAKAANRKTLTINNDWTEEQEKSTDDGNWYGSGFKKIYTDSKGVQKHKNLCPWNIIWNLHDFKNSPKMEVMNRTVKEVTDNKRYKQSARTRLKELYKDTEEKLNARIDIYQYIDDEKMYIVDIMNKIVLMEGNKPEGLNFSKYDHEYRRGFNDAPGIGMCEKAINIIIQNKVARERYNKVEDIVTKMIFAKVVDGKGDKVQNKQIQNLKTGLIIPLTNGDNLPQPVNMGGVNQLTELSNKIASTSNMFDKIFQTPEVLGGDAKTLGANSSGVAIQTLTENASSVHKDIKKRYARVAEKEYRDYIMPYNLKVFNSEDNIKKYLDTTEWNVVRKNIIDYQLAVKQAELLGSGVAPEEVSAILADEEVKLRKELKSKKIITKDILEALREDVQSIQIVISGEKASRQVRTEFFDKVKNEYMANPQILDDPRYIGLTKKQAKNVGLDELTITEFINDIK